MTSVKTSDLARLLVAIHSDISRLEILLESLAIREKELLRDLKDRDATDKIKAAEGTVQFGSDEWDAIQDRYYDAVFDLRRVRIGIRGGKISLRKLLSRHARIKQIYDGRWKPVDQGLMELMQERDNKKRGN